MINTMLKNRFFFIVLMLFVICFGLIGYLSISKLFKKEVVLRHSVANTQLLSAASTVSFFFSGIRAKLLFLKDEPGIQDFAGSGFKSPEYRKQVVQDLSGLVSHSGNIRQAYIFDPFGYEILHTDRKKASAEPATDHDHITKGVLVFKKGSQQDPVRYYPITRPESGTPGMAVSVSLFDGYGYFQGYLVFNIDLLQLFKILPENISIQTSSGDRISLEQGRIVHDKSPLLFSGNSAGEIESRRVSRTETLHFKKVPLTEARYLVVVKTHEHAPLSGLMKKLLLQAAGVFIVFFGFISALALSTLSRIREKIKADKTMIHALITLTDWRDPETGDHLNRTRQYCAILAKRLRKKQGKFKISKQFIEDIYESAPLHDIGKVGIKDAILLKPGRFTPAEYEQMKRHVDIGKLIINDLIARLPGSQSVLKMALNICEFHHEKFNGTGYSKGLRGKEIPLEARIFAVADVYDALRSERPYKKRMDHRTVLHIIQKESGKHFDPDIVEIFMDAGDEFERISTDYEGVHNIPLLNLPAASVSIL